MDQQSRERSIDTEGKMAKFQIYCAERKLNIKWACYMVPFMWSCEKPCQSLVRKESELWMTSAGSVKRKRGTAHVLDSRRKCEGAFSGDSNVLL